MTNVKSYARHAQIAAQVIQFVMMENLHLMPPASYTLTQRNGYVWLVAAMDTISLGGRLDAYEHENVTHQLSTSLSEAFGTKQHIPVVMANHTGLRYCVLFGKRPTLPRRVEFPGFGERDVFRLGIDVRGEISLKAGLMKNVIIGAAPEYGKSNVMRLITHQARAFGWSLYLADSQAHTFNPDIWDAVACHPVARSIEYLLVMLEAVSADIEDRSVRFRSLANGGVPAADLDAFNAIAPEPLPRILVAIDEASTPLQDKRVFKKIAALLREGRKFGLHVIMAGHEWHKEVIQAEVNDMLQTRIALPMIDAGSGYTVTRSHQWGSWVIGKPIGRGVLRTNQFTPMQFFLVTEEQEATWMAPNAVLASPLPGDEMALAQRSLAEAEGKMTIDLLQGWGLSEWDARSLIDRYELRGWVAKDPQQKNARYLTPKLVDLVSNLQTAQTASNTQIRSQTDLKQSQTPDVGTTHRTKEEP